MKMWTSYYGNMRNIPKDYFVVAASGGLTDEIAVAVDSWNQSLAPSKSIFFDYKEDGDWEKYVKRFKEERLPEIDWLEKLEQWEEKANQAGKTLDNIVLLCYEKPEDHCHRQILAEDFEEQFKCEVKEYGFENTIRTSNYNMMIKNNTDILF